MKILLGFIWLVSLFALMIAGFVYHFKIGGWHYLWCAMFFAILIHLYSKMERLLFED